MCCLRQEIVGPPFGQMKHNQGFQRFICWGKEGACAESVLICFAHNVKKCMANAGARVYLMSVFTQRKMLSRFLQRFTYVMLTLTALHQHYCRGP